MDLSTGAALLSVWPGGPTAAGWLTPKMHTLKTSVLGGIVNLQVVTSQHGIEHTYMNPGARFHGEVMSPHFSAMKHSFSTE